MDEQFDEKLKSRITEVFDNYEFPPADEAWLELRKKFPVKQERKIAWLWWSSAAAILLVFLGVGLWLINKPDASTNLAVNHNQPLNHATKQTDSVKHAEAVQNNVASAQPQQGNINDTSINTNRATKGQALTPAASDTYITGNNKPAGKQYAPFGNANALPVVVDGNKNTSIAKQDQNATTVAATPPVNKQAPVNTTTLPDVQKPAIVKTDQQQVAKIDVPVTINSQTDAANGKASPVITKQPVKTIDDLFKDSKPQIAQQKADKKELKKVNFSVYAATYINYAEGSANQVNAGAGFTSDIRLGKRVKLSTGISLAQNTLSYAGLPPATGVDSRAFAAAAAPDIKQSGSFSPAASVAELKNYNASLVGLDIPINIKYEFNPEKSDTYVSAGLSSGTFIDERYTYRYAYHNNSFGNNSVTTQDQTSTKSFNSFYFGKTLNLSFGTGFPIGKTNRLVIEPFLKYPLGGMGTQSIHFGSGGVNLKFNFKATKK
ncbi:hypothetical protein IDJ77_25315 [Mucilaginibacter sp. ZT4R22]|uniref:Outer membrane protein with beta-barrel domain n=1 Tax=Mucilaginibacter pankratovii TaxID=2772110 RepID=A0ABR7WXY3_9SPHI|nr:hypothetical protein [Mucilaginibacter pankratovii]MBD1367156.1 hypothetical protein [Mucilaginibacter pankratovii]